MNVIAPSSCSLTVCVHPLTCRVSRSARAAGAPALSRRRPADEKPVLYTDDGKRASVSPHRPPFLHPSPLGRGALCPHVRLRNTCPLCRQGPAAPLSAPLESLPAPFTPGLPGSEATLRRGAGEGVRPPRPLRPPVQARQRPAVRNRGGPQEGGGGPLQTPRTPNPEPWPPREPQGPAAPGR